MTVPRLSVVAPCFNEEEVLPEFHQRVSKVCQALGHSYEIVLVNDGSHDHTWQKMIELAAADPALVLVNLSRNYGHQLALTAGLSVCSGEYVLILDADLQDPPELLPRMLGMIRDGADVVYGQRRRRLGESSFKLVTAALFYRFPSLNASCSRCVASNAGEAQIRPRDGDLDWFSAGADPIRSRTALRRADKVSLPENAKVFHRCRDCFFYPPTHADYLAGIGDGMLGSPFDPVLSRILAAGQDCHGLDKPDGNDGSLEQCAAACPGHHRRVSGAVIRADERSSPVHHRHDCEVAFHSP
jgi:glycosyltransferase involved in cell wall biosynthesis